MPQPHQLASCFSARESRLPSRSTGAEATTLCPLRTRDRTLQGFLGPLQSRPRNDQSPVNWLATSSNGGFHLCPKEDLNHSLIRSG